MRYFSGRKTIVNSLFRRKFAAANFQRSTGMNPQVTEKIEQLILQAADPKDKAFLLIQLEMSKSLFENTQLTKELHAEFTSHAKEEMALIIKGRFLWRILLAFALILQVVLGKVLNDHLENHAAVVAEVRQLRLELEIFKERQRKLMGQP
jgi:hypothetical protein